MASAARAVTLVIGAVMLGLGLLIVIRLALAGAPLSASVWLDLAFAGFFLLRGAMLVRRLRRPRR